MLREAREKLEDIIDALHADLEVAEATHVSRKSRLQYLLVVNEKKASIRVLRNATGQQLKYVRRDLQITTGNDNKMRCVASDE